MEHQSETVTEIIPALILARGEITGALAKADNPFFNSKYADLKEVIDSCTEQLLKVGIMMTQTGAIVEGLPCIVTQATHTSGEFIRSILPIKHMKGNDPQSFGSGITYVRRYGLISILNMPVYDDDGESAMDREEKEEVIGEEKGWVMGELFKKAGYSQEEMMAKISVTLGVDDLSLIPVKYEEKVRKGLLNRIDLNEKMDVQSEEKGK